MGACIIQCQDIKLIEQKKIHSNFQDVSKVVDKSALADEKYSQALARQLELERRFSDLTRRINQVIPNYFFACCLLNLQWRFEYRTFEDWYSNGPVFKGKGWATAIQSQSFKN